MVATRRRFPAAGSLRHLQWRVWFHLWTEISARKRFIPANGDRSLTPILSRSPHDEATSENLRRLPFAARRDRLCGDPLLPLNRQEAGLEHHQRRDPRPIGPGDISTPVVSRPPNLGSYNSRSIIAGRPATCQPGSWCGCAKIPVFSAGTKMPRLWLSRARVGLYRPDGGICARGVMPERWGALGRGDGMVRCP